MRITIDTIVKDDNPLLREKSMDVSFPLSKEDDALWRSLLTYVEDSTDPQLAEQYHLRPAVGIAAIQVGVLKKMMAVVIHEEDRTITHALINPKIISHSLQKAYLKNGEGCLSAKQECEGYVPRAARITVEGYDACKKAMVRIRAKGYEAIVLQHEMDHFQGVMYYDHINGSEPYKEIDNAIIIE